VGDQIVAIGGAPVTDGASVTAALAPVRPGDTVPVGVVRDGAQQTVDVPTGQIVRTESKATSGRSGSGTTTVTQCLEQGASLPKGATATGDPCFGIAIQAFVDYQFPIDVQFDLSRVGGPSAGLAFALAVVDDLTPGDLTGGQHVAITGAIAPDGSVQPVGGVEQKAITARNQGVGLMIVPRDELPAARRGAGDMPVVGVDSLDDALAALQQHGGAPVPPPTTTAARS
jgi:PDZ domain-containing protein